MEDAEDTECGEEVESWRADGWPCSRFRFLPFFEVRDRLFVLNSWACGVLAAVCARKRTTGITAEDAEDRQRAEEGRCILPVLVEGEDTPRILLLAERGETWRGAVRRRSEGVVVGAP
jgi:hypothetical protein